MVRKKTSIAIRLLLIGIILSQSAPIIKALSIPPATQHVTNLNAVVSQADLTAPTIESVKFLPPIPTEDDDVLVNATISDDESGVNSSRVHVYYRCDGGQWNQTRMQHLISGSPTEVYLAHIPKQANGTKVEFYIEAYDNTGNRAVDDNLDQYYVYTVVPEFPTWPLLLLMFMVLTAIIIYVKRRT